jgi:hypothetical protein
MSVLLCTCDVMVSYRMLVNNIKKYCSSTVELHSDVFFDDTLQCYWRESTGKYYSVVDVMPILDYEQGLPRKRRLLAQQDARFTDYVKDHARSDSVRMYKIGILFPLVSRVVSSKARRWTTLGCSPFSGILLYALLSASVYYSLLLLISRCICVHRSRLGKCTKCSYKLFDMTICPECGKVLSHQHKPHEHGG